MALIKSFETSFGVSASYWRISGLPMIDDVARVAQIQLSGYYDKAARQANAAPMQTKIIVIDGANYPPTGTSLADVASSLMLLPEWSDATQDTSIDS